MRRPALTIAAALLPGAASAHDAFGDLGPFYASLLHPLADPAQGLLIAAVAVLLARQPLATVRIAYAALAICGALAVAAHAAVSPAPLGLRATGIAVALLGLVALSGLRIPATAAAAIAAASAVASPPPSPSTCPPAPAPPPSQPSAAPPASRSSRSSSGVASSS